MDPKWEGPGQVKNVKSWKGVASREEVTRISHKNFIIKINLVPGDWGADEVLVPGDWGAEEAIDGIQWTRLRFLFVTSGEDSRGPNSWRLGSLFSPLIIMGDVISSRNDNNKYLSLNHIPRLVKYTNRKNKIFTSLPLKYDVWKYILFNPRDATFTLSLSAVTAKPLYVCAKSDALSSPELTFHIL